MSKRPLLPFGYPCIYYIGAEMKEEHRCTAKCVKDNGESVNLIVEPVQGGMSRLIRNVRHVTDPWHKSNPVVSQQCGSWDYVDGLPLPYAGEPVAASKPEKKLQTAS